MAETVALMQMAQGGAQIARGFGERGAMRAEADATTRAAAIEAESMRHRANEARGAGQMAARERKEATDRVMGRQVAIAAASGAGASGGTILDLIGETAERGEMQRQGEFAKGESKARGFEDKAAFGQWQAETKANSLRAKGDAAMVGSIFEGATKMGVGGYKYGERQGWFDPRPDSDDTDVRTGWRTRVYKAR